MQQYLLQFLPQCGADGQSYHLGSEPSPIRTKSSIIVSTITLLLD